HRPVQVRQRIVRRVGLGLLNPAFDLADGFEVVADLGAITRSEFAVQARDVCPPCCRLLRTSSRKRFADAPPPAAASWATTTRDYFDTRRRSRCRIDRPLEANPSPAPATAVASLGRSVSRRSDPPSYPD